MKTEVEIINVNRSGYRELISENGRRTAVSDKKRVSRRKRRLYRIYYTVAGLLFIAIVLMVIVFIKNFPKEGISHNKEYENIAEEYVPNRPKEINESEVMAELKTLTAQYPEFQEIYDNAAQYPEKLLAALCNNPEMHEFVKGYPDADGSVTEGLSDSELSEEFPLLLQWDKRWGYASYGDSMIGLAGCGPTCLSMVITALTDAENITPDVVAAYSMENGYYVEGTGTAWSLMTDGVSRYGINAAEISLDENVMKTYLDRGCPIICSMRPGDFTAAGHFIVIYGYDKEGFLVNDPNCIARSNKRWSFEELFPQIRILWAYSCS